MKKNIIFIFFILIFFNSKYTYSQISLISGIGMGFSNAFEIDTRQIDFWEIEEVLKIHYQSLPSYNARIIFDINKFNKFKPTLQFGLITKNHMINSYAVDTIFDLNKCYFKQKSFYFQFSLINRNYITNNLNFGYGFTNNFFLKGISKTNSFTIYKKFNLGIILSLNYKVNNFIFSLDFQTDFTPFYVNDILPFDVTIKAFNYNLITSINIILFNKK